MPNRQEPVTVEMILKMCKMAKKEHEDSCMAAFSDWLIVGIYTNNRKSRWAQEHHIGHRCSLYSEGPHPPRKEWYRFQKNKDNGQMIQYSRSSNNILCLVRTSLGIRRRAQR
eukprot:8892757-Ditylum_brightwellii.AAC.1